MLALDTPATPSAAVKAMQSDWDLIAALLGGTSAMQAAGIAYLPKHPAESAAAYKYRVSVSTLFNGFARTVETLSGKPFSEPLKLGDDVPPAIVEYCDDIDLEGRNLQSFAHDVMRTVLSFGLTHILVDYPSTPAGQTLADQRVSGSRPYFVHITPQNMLGWRYERINGAETLTQIRIMETVEEPDGEWATKQIPQVRVLEPYRFSIYRQNEKQEWLLYEEGLVSLGFIPLSTVYGDRTGFMTAKPPLMNLADLNKEHWRKSSDHSNLLSTAQVPILLATGFDNDTLVLGANAAVCNESPDSDLRYVEPTCKGLEAAERDLSKIEERMSVMGGQLLVHRPGSRTATEKAIDTAESDSALSLMALNLEDSLELALQFVADWDGLPTGGTMKLCDDFSGGVDPTNPATVIQAKEMGVLSAETTFGELQRYGVISEELVWEDEKAKMIAEGPVLGILGSFEAPPGQPKSAP